ncbi:MAG: hypothetical protein INR69_22925, partial [Mucilaginibacter polytrichastri]|nr:hypothetical protein [Mucilaginibacter polytrichastri]
MKNLILILGSACLSLFLGGFVANAAEIPQYAPAIAAGIFATSFIPMKAEAGTMFFALTAKNIDFNQGGINPGGVGQHIYYAFEEDIASWPDAIANANPLTATTFDELVEVPADDAFVFKAGKCFFKAYCTLEEGEIKSTLVGVRDSMSW